MAVLEGSRGEVAADDAKKYAGQWVAVKDNRVLFASQDAAAVLDWVENNRRDDIDLVLKLRKEGAPKRWSL
ncbi:MAG: hypothetical protein HY216_15985 [Candidatus Rokubacteria bacterium]|nr:hypothetical protein [Candidatus Rokubacteria bacterium]